MLPIALHGDGRRALIVGGGNVALRKAHALLAAGLTLRVVAPAIDARLRALIDETHGSLALRPYAPEDLDGVALAVAATDREEVNAAVVDDARGARVLVCDAVHPERGDFTMQATVRVGDLTFTIDSGGSTPAFAKRLARELGERFDARYDAAARTLARMRAYVRTALDDDAERGAVMRELAELPIDELAAMNPIAGEDRVESVLALRRHGDAARATASVICASRASALAMTQTRMVAARLAERGTATTIVNVTTTGDRVQDRPIAAIGSENVWVKELEVALRDGRADYAVHSCKDLPGALAPDMHLAAISRREDPRDAFCSERYARFEDLPAGAVVGTSSLRRRTQLQALRPDLRYEDIRGNVDTRLRKLRDGQYDAIVLAMAGLNRLHVRATHTVPFATETMVPAVAQGALAIEVLAAKTHLTQLLRDAVNDEATERCVAAERAALRLLRAGCNAPLGIHAGLDGETMTIDAAYAQGDPPAMIRERIVGVAADGAQAEELGERIARALQARIAPNRPRSVVLPRTQERPSRIAEHLRARGIDVIELREGEHGPDPHALLPDFVLFPSSGSVAAAGRYLDALRNAERRPRVAAMGPQSGAAARDAGFEPDVISPDASIDAFVAIVTEQLEA